MFGLLKLFFGNKIVRTILWAEVGVRPLTVFLYAKSKPWLAEFVSTYVSIAAFVAAQILMALWSRARIRKVLAGEPLMEEPGIRASLWLWKKRKKMATTLAVSALAFSPGWIWFHSFPAAGMVMFLVFLQLSFLIGWATYFAQAWLVKA